MDIDILAAHVVLAAALLLLLSWIGQHSLSSGYVTLSAFVRADEAPAFNLAFRVLGPIVYITMAASGLYLVKLDRYVADIWLVAAYYCAARAAYIFIFDRVRLVNWRREVLTWSAVVGGSWLLYGTIISNRESLLPEIKDLKNQFWILLILFLFTAFNNVRLPREGLHNPCALGPM
jgi:hypothetical protein